MHHAVPYLTLAALLREILGLLRQVQPAREDGDVLWLGPFFIPRRGQWWPTRFILYQNELYCTVEIGWSTITLIWWVGTEKVAFEDQPCIGSGYRHSPELWKEVLQQAERRLRRALTDPAAYNRRVARLLPLGCRTGRIRRRLTWPKATRRPLSLRELGLLEEALARGKSARSWRSLSVRHYLEVAALAYDVVFGKLKELTPLEKYERKADRRHGGMLDLPPEDPRAFARWHSSRTWQGAHPWEIVFAHPHGVLLSPHRHGRTWRFFLSVDTLGLYGEAARMAIALGQGGVPFELLLAPEIIAALRGEDWVEVGPFHDQLSFEELEGRRQGITAHIVWDPPPCLIRREIPAD